MGYIAALFFALFSILNMAPLVGASGSLSGIMAFYCLKNIKTPIRYFWIVGFNKGYSGIVYLPAWIAFVMWFVADLAGYFGSIEVVSGVAFLAHLGGEAAGAACAFAIIGFQYFTQLFFRRKATS